MMVTLTKTIKVMKRIFFLSTIFIFLLFSCEKKEIGPIMDLDKTIPPEILEPMGGGAYVLDSAIANNIFAVFKWNAMAYELDIIASPVYSLEVGLAGQDFARISTILSTQNLSDSVIVESLNGSLIRLGVPWDVSNDFEFRIRGIISSSNVTEKLAAYSDAITMTITPYEPPVFKLNVPGAYQGWSPDGPPYLWSSDDVAFAGYIYFPDDNTEFKFAKGGWADDTHWSYGGSPGKLVLGGGDNLVQEGHGTYFFEVDLNALTYIVELRTWGIYAEGWGEDLPMDFDPEIQTDFSCILTITTDLTEGTELFFRANNDPELSMGEVDPPNGLNIELGGTPILIQEAGNYTITLDLTEMLIKYEILKN
jgi:starch-binding outer membrane protein SusE/F